ncbi:MAG: glycosyltransferase [Erysipelotrichaceae bacterium]|nr:glycosyltransferase [Erysipelotrichaceae bacterium]
MKILFLIDSLSGGGAERACLNIASLLCDFHDVWVASLFSVKKDPGYLYDDRINIVRLEIRNSKHLKDKPRLYEQEYHRVKALKKQICPDLCISFLETSGFLNVITGGSEKKIVSVRNYYSVSLRQERYFFRRIKAAVTLKLADKIVAVSKDCKKDLVDNFGVSPDKIVSIYNFYDPNRSAPAPRSNAVRLFMKDGMTHRIISIGRFHMQKAQQHLIRAFKAVSEKYPGAVLFLFGKGETEAYLQKVIAANGLENQIVLMPFDPNTTWYLERADLYVSTSLNEGFSNSMLEALASGTPVISSDCHSGPRELLAPDTDFSLKTVSAEYAEYGVLIPEFTGHVLTDEPLERSEELLAEAMIRLLEHPQIRAGYSAKEKKRVQDFSSEKIIAQWRTVIDDVCSGNS